MRHRRLRRPTDGTGKRGAGRQPVFDGAHLVQEVREGKRRKLHAHQDLREVLDGVMG